MLSTKSSLTTNPRSIGVFRASSNPSLNSWTVAHDGTFANQRSMARQQVEKNQKPKVGVLESSQVTSLRSATASGKNIQRTDYSNPDINVVKSALNRVRNQSCVPPKKGK